MCSSTVSVEVEMEHRGLSDIITAPITEFCRISGLGRSKVYELLNDGLLDSVRFGKRRLILLASYHQLIERQRGTIATGKSKVVTSPSAGQTKALD
jgi:excisionase family DNA binding protein